MLDGGPAHQDSEGHNGVIHPGLVQRMSAGTDILHGEKRDSRTLTGKPAHQAPVHFIQVWVLPDEAGIKPGYEQLDIDDELALGGWTTLASGLPRRAIGIRRKHAALHVARVRPGKTLLITTAPFTHLFLARGSRTGGCGPAGLRRRGPHHRRGGPAHHCRPRRRRRPDVGNARRCHHGVTRVPIRAAGLFCRGIS